MKILFKFTFVAIAAMLFSLGSVEASGLPGGGEKKNPATQVTDNTQTSESEIAPSLFRRRGNVIGYTEITIDLGVLKIKRVRVDCDGDPEVRCVYKKGEQILTSNQLLTTYEVPSIGIEFGGIEHDVQIQDNQDGSSSSIFDFVID